jgi:hypothetical protein
MNAWQRFLAFLAGILGEDSTLVVALNDADPADPDALELGDEHGLTDDQVVVLAGLYNVDTDTVNEVANALVAAAQDDEIELATVAEIADTVDGLRWVVDVRAEVDEREATERAELLARLGTDAPEADAEADEADEAPAEIEAEADAPAEVDEADEAPADEQEPVAVTAAAPRIGRVAARRTPGADSMRRTVDALAEQSTQWTMLDQVGTLGLGAEVDDSAMTEALARRLDEIGRRSGQGSGDGIRHTFASITREYPEDRDLTRFGRDEAGVYLDRYIKDAQAALRTSSDPVKALTASGGLCTPRVPVYDIPTIAGMERPVQSFLPTFRAERGGITFRPGRSIRTLGAIDSANSGIAVQTIARDEQGVNKPVYRVPCPATENADVYAIPARLVHGNFLERFDPEAVATAVTLQGALHARVAETELLNSIDTASDDVQTQAQGTATIGFARAYLVNLDTLAAGIRSRERSGATFVLDHLAPFWLLNALRADLVMELPGSSEERLATADSYLESFFSVRNIRPGWFIDQQNMGLQVDEGNVTTYPNEVVSYVFEPGHHVALDGGELTIGVYRDSALNQENDAETFMETFEGLAPRGVVSYALHSDICITGATSAAVDVNCSLNS